MKKVFLPILLLILILMTGLAVFHTSRGDKSSAALEQGDLFEKIKKEIRQELQEEFNQEIRQIVKEEVKREIEVYMVKSEQRALDKYSKKPKSFDAEYFNDYLITDEHEESPYEQHAGLASPSLTESPGSKQEAIRRIIREILSQEMNIVKDEELDTYVAGSGIEPDLPIAAGLTKKFVYDEYLLAAATPGEQPISRDKGGDKDSGQEILDVTAGKERADSIERTLVQKGSILLPKGKLQVEPSTTWAHFSTNRISIQGFSILPVLVIGQISTETVKRNIMIENLSMKYGLLNNFQVEVKVPARYEHDRVTDTNSAESTRTSGGLGDIEFGMSRQVGWEHGLIPDMVAAVNVKADTGKSPYNRDIGLGTGHWAVRGTLIAAKSSDPAVVFGSLNYTYNMERDIDNFGQMNPGNTISYSLGTAIALSYQTAINFSFDHSVTSKLEQDGSVVSGSFLNSANLKAGFNWAINEKSSIDFGVSVGLTPDSPDVSVDVRFPYTF